jgi:hypothetical protein
MDQEETTRTEKKFNSFISNNLSPPIGFHLNRVGNGIDDILSEEHLKIRKLEKNSYLLLELVIFVKIFEFFLMTQSL